MSDTIFDKIVRGELQAWTIWEDDNYLAFLTPIPNTPGASVVIPKNNPGDYIFSVGEDVFTGLMTAAKKVANILEKAFDTPRVALVFEGTGVAYVHAKLFPLHGELAGATEVWSKHQEYYPEYVGYLSTVEGPRMSDDELTAIQQKILEVQS